MHTLYDITTRAQVLYPKVFGVINTNIGAVIGISKTRKEG